MDPADQDSPEFQALVSGALDIDIALVALEIARDAYPTLDLPACLGEIQRLADRCALRLGPTPEPWLIIEAMNSVLFLDEGFRGNEHDYYDPRNSYLNEVLTRRLGIPISLSVLYMTIARRLGLVLQGINVPTHFMLRTTIDGEHVYVDPYHGGRVMDAAALMRFIEIRAQAARLPLPLPIPEALGPVAQALIVRRMLYNLKFVHLNTRRLPAAIPVMRRLALLSPDQPSELRDLGIACIYGGQRQEGCGYLEEYLRRAPDAVDAPQIRNLLHATPNAAGE